MSGDINDITLRDICSHNGTIVQTVARPLHRGQVCAVCEYCGQTFTQGELEQVYLIKEKNRDSLRS